MRRCSRCGANLDPEERCDCGGPVFRRITGGVAEEIDRETFMDILRSMREENIGATKNHYQIHGESARMGEP